MITNREEANEYYQRVNQLVDEYINEWGIRPSSLMNYLNPGSKRFKQFLARNGLNEISGTDKILRDVIEDRCALESDGVLTFENYKFIDENNQIESDIFKGIENSELSHEKSISDYFDIDLSSIDIVDSKKHLFKVIDWNGTDLLVVVFDKEDIDLIKFNIMESIMDKTSKELKEVMPGVNIQLSEIIDSEKLNKKLESGLTEEIITRILSSELGEEWDFESKIGNFYLFVC